MSKAKTPTETSRRVVGLHVNPRSYRNHSVRYMQLVYEVTYSDATQRTDFGTPFFDHDIDEALTPLLGVTCEVWKCVVPELERRDEANRTKRRSHPRKKGQ